MQKKASSRKNKPTACFGAINDQAVGIEMQPISQPSSSNNNSGDCINCTRDLSDTVKSLTDQVNKSAQILGNLGVYETKLKEALRDKIKQLKVEWSELSEAEKQKRLNEIDSAQAKCNKCEDACAQQLKVLKDQTEKLEAAMQNVGQNLKGDSSDTAGRVRDFVAEVTSSLENIEDGNANSMGRVVASAFGISNYKKSKKSKMSKKSKK